MKRILLILIFGAYSSSYAQLTTNLLDNFNRSDNNTVGLTPTDPTSLTWNESETVSGTSAQISSNKLVVGSTTAGREWCYLDMSGVSSYPTTLNTATGIVTWAFNMRTSRSDPSGFGNGSYGLGFILATSVSTDITIGTGYAVIIGGSGNPDIIRFARFTGGFNSSSDFVDLITGGSFAGNEYFSVKVTYNPSGNNWSLYVESNAASYPQIDPRNTSTQIGSTTSNSTYVASDLKNLGPLWNHGTADETAEFDDIYVSDPGGALPVELTSFSAFTNDKTVKLNWRTATEVNNYGFEIERSVKAMGNSDEAIGDGDKWMKIGFVQGCGNSNSPKNYSYTDEPFGGKEFKYRLKQIDFDGAFEYSDEVTAVFNDVTAFELEQNYPNPFNPSTKISYTIPKRSNVKLRVYNMLAQLEAELVDESQEAGHYQVIFNGSNLPSGTYFYKLEAGKFVEVKKFILVK